MLTLGEHSGVKTALGLILDSRVQTFLRDQSNVNQSSFELEWSMFLEKKVSTYISKYISSVKTLTKL